MPKKETEEQTTYHQYTPADLKAADELEAKLTDFLVSEPNPVVLLVIGSFTINFIGYLYGERAADKLLETFREIMKH